MKVSELTAENLANYARYSLGADEYDALPDETKAEISMALTASKSYVQNFCGINIDEYEAEDLALAVLVVGAEMLDNRQLTAQYSARNPLVMSILNMHRFNLMPEEVELFEETEEGDDA